MSYQYCTKEQVKELATPEVDLTGEGGDQIDALINSVSVWIDTYTKFPEGYFLPAGDTATLRKYRGEDKPYLRIGPYVDDATITIPVIAAALIYTDRNGWIRYNDSVENQPEDFFYQRRAETFFSKHTVYTVSAKWGFAATPDDIVLACALIVGDIYDRGKGVIGQISPSGFIIERTMPLAARDILNGRKKREFQII